MSVPTRRVRTPGEDTRPTVSPMAVGTEPRSGSGAAPSPPEFAEAVRAMGEARMRPEVLCEPMPAPQRIAPYAAALLAE